MRLHTRSHLPAIHALIERLARRAELRRESLAVFAQRGDDRETFLARSMLR